MYDIIGDIHGYSGQLEALLKRMGYCCEKGYYAHPQRKAVFVGDYIDRGPGIRRTLQIVKNMVENGAAHAIMGNHEYDALAFFTQTASGSFLKKRSRRRIKRHKKTIEAFRVAPHEGEMFLEWLWSLPLFLELDGLRFVHACWDDEQIEYLKKRLPDARLSPEFLAEASQPKTKANKAVQTILHGKKIALPGETTYRLGKNKLIRDIRVKWWKTVQTSNYKSMAVNAQWFWVVEKIPQILLRQTPIGYPENAPPVFFGHYWIRGMPRVQKSNVCCVDYSVAKNGRLVAYRHYGEKKLSNKNFCYVQKNNLMKVVRNLASMFF